jgi:putative N6-adenine-specific DNA methylase
MFDGKLKNFRSEGGTVKTEAEKNQMAEKHRFKKEREFKKRIDEQEENDEADIRSFTFHHHEIKTEEHAERKIFRRNQDRLEDRSADKKRNSRSEGKDRFDNKKRGGRFESTNRGGHERFDRSGGKKPMRNKNKRNEN